MKYNSSEYRQLQHILHTELNYALFCYPGGIKPKLKIINPEGLTMMYADFDRVINSAIELLDRNNIKHHFKISYDV